MCIRDRAHTRCPSEATTSVRLPVPQPKSATRAGAGGSARAVSYTHLRAHETVLDLVCRLLLEKKKPHIQQPTIYQQNNEHTNHMRLEDSPKHHAVT